MLNEFVDDLVDYWHDHDLDMSMEYFIQSVMAWSEDQYLDWAYSGRVEAVRD